MQRQGPTRRWLLGAAAAYLAVGARATKAADTLRIASLDWSLTEVALCLGVTPICAAETPGYRAWVGVPALPADVVNLGLRVQPNLELLQQLAPTLILTLPERGDIAPSLQQIAPLLSLPIYTSDHAPYTRSVSVTEELGARLGLEMAATKAVAKAEHALKIAKDRIAHLPKRPIVIVRFVDPTTVFVFGRGSLFDDVLRRLGFVNGWASTPSRWGFARTNIAALATLARETQLFYIEAPVSPEVRVMMASDPLWLAMPFVRSPSVYPLPAIWFFGALAAAERFASALTERLIEAYGEHHDAG